MIRAVLASILLLTLIATPAKAAGAWRAKECRYQYVDGRRGWSQWEVKLTIECASQKFSVDTSTALYIADRESNFDQYATNPYSGACGPYQHLPAYFPERLRAVPQGLKPFGGSCYNARDNVLAALWMARSGWGPWS